MIKTQYPYEASLSKILFFIQAIRQLPWQGMETDHTLVVDQVHITPTFIETVPKIQTVFFRL